MNKITLSDLVPNNVIRYALNSKNNFTFDKLKKSYPNLKSMSEFITILGKTKINLTGTQEQLRNLSPDESLFICKKVLENIEQKVKQEKKKIIVTKSFYPFFAKESFEKEVKRKVQIDGEYGLSQNSMNSKYQFDLAAAEWYVYNDNFGTSEEKAFVKWFNNIVPILQNKKYKDIFLVRNEVCSKKGVKFYSWFKDKENVGEGFEPDFVLLMQKENIEYIFYIETKGNWAYDSRNKDFGKEQWKENFLLEIESVAIKQQQNPLTKIKELDNCRLIGLPFYNEEHTAQQLTIEFDKIS